MKGVRWSWQREDRRGAMLVLIAVCLPLCVIMAAFAVDVAWMQLVRTELRTATDAAARAGAKSLSLYQDEDRARAGAIEAAARHLVAGQPLRLSPQDVAIGVSQRANDDSRFTFTPVGNLLNAVRVSAGRTNDSEGGAVDLLFGRVFGVRTFQPREVATATLLDRDICLVVDRSGSMMWTLGKGSQYPKGSGVCDPPHPTLSRWGALAIAVEAFLRELDKTPSDELLALVSYSSNTTECGIKYNISDINCDLTNDYSRIRSAMDTLSSKPVKGRTAISAGLDDGIKVLTSRGVRPFAVKTMILLTDGIHNQGPEPIISARKAAKEDIVIHTITFSADADINRMQEVAAATGGKHFHADDARSLVEIFRELAAMPVLLTE